MSDEKADVIALFKEIADSPRRDNSTYHKAMGEARRAFLEAEAALGGSVRVKIKFKRKSKNEYTVKWTFKRARD